MEFFDRKSRWFIEKTEQWSQLFPALFTHCVCSLSPPPWFSLFMAAQGHEVPLLPCRRDKKTYKLAKKLSEHKAALLKLGRRCSSCFSSQDLRCFEMEKEKEFTSSPRGVIDACTSGLGNETESSRNSTSVSEILSSNATECPEIHSSKSSHWKKFLALWRKSSIKRLSSLRPLPMPRIPRRKCVSLKESVDIDYCTWRSAWKNFTFSELQIATNNFSHDNLIGKGGHAEVYKGCLPDGQFVAIKRLNQGTPEERSIDFLSELGIIAHVDHPNTAKLIGYGVERGTFIVLKLSSLGSLGSLLHGSKEKLNWRVRHKIILGIADGLHYLHEGCRKRIIHRDIKADNILLTEDFEPQIGDFGLAKWLPKQWSHQNVPKFEGTFGYFAPEYFMHGIVDEKTDVYAFGVLLLELITGRQALDNSQQSLLIWAKPLLDKNEVKELVDPCLGDQYDPEQMDRVILAASMCVEHSAILRPRMSQAIQLLRGDDYKPEYSKEHQKQLLRRTYSEDFFDPDEYDSTKVLSDLKRHRQVALGL